MTEEEVAIRREFERTFSAMYVYRPSVELMRVWFWFVLVVVPLNVAWLLILEILTKVVE